MKPVVWRVVTDLPCVEGFSASPVPSTGETQLALRPSRKKEFIETLLHRGLIPGDQVTRLYSNLVVLFRMLAFYVDVREGLLWDAVWSDWGVTRKDCRPIAQHIVEYYVNARRRSKALEETTAPSLLARLVDHWVEKRPEVAKELRVGEQGLRVRRAAWKTLRDTRLGMLLDAAQPLCLRLRPEHETSVMPRANDSAGGRAPPSKKAKKARWPKQKKRDARAQREQREQQDTQGNGNATRQGVEVVENGNQPAQMEGTPKRKREDDPADQSPAVKCPRSTPADAGPPSFNTSRAGETETGEQTPAECCNIDCPYRKQVAELEMRLQATEAYLYRVTRRCVGTWT